MLNEKKSSINRLDAEKIITFINTEPIIKILKVSPVQKTENSDDYKRAYN